MTRIHVTVIPGAGEDAIQGWRGTRLRVKVRAPPEHGKANEAAQRLIAQRLGVAKNSVRIVLGSRSRMKVFEIDGLKEKDVRERSGGPRYSG